MTLLVKLCFSDFKEEDIFVSYSDYRGYEDLNQTLKGK